jgi:hypothetical protein
MTCHLFGFKVGESRSFTFRVTSSSANDAVFTGATQPDRVSTSVQMEQPGVRVLDTDTNYQDNQADNTITLS